jgi:hypothetical protein
MPSDRDTEQTAESREQDRVDQQLPRDASLARAEGGADGQLVLARDRTRQHQIRRIRAGDEQQKHDRAEEHEQRTAHVAGQTLAQ